MTNAIQEGLQRRLNMPDDEAGSRWKVRGTARVASVAGVMGREFRGPSFTVMPEQLERIRQQVASSATLLVLLSNALLSEPTALVALVAAYDLGKAIVGLRVDAVDGVPAEALAYDEEVATTALHNLAAYLTRKHPDVLAAMEASGLDVADMGRKCLNVARNLKARNIVHVPNATLTPDASSSAVSGSSAPRGPRVLLEVSSSEVSSSEVSSSEALRGAPRYSEVSSSEVSSSEVSSSEALRGAPRYSTGQVA